MTKKAGHTVPSATVLLQYGDFTETQTICLSPTRVVEIVRHSEDQGLSVKGVFWTTDGSVMLSKASVPDFLAQRYEYQLGWINTMWAAMLQSPMQIRPVNKGGKKDSRVAAKAGKALMHWMVVPLIAAILAAVCLEQAASHFNTPEHIPALDSIPCETRKGLNKFRCGTLGLVAKLVFIQGRRKARSTGADLSLYGRAPCAERIRNIGPG